MVLILSLFINFFSYNNESIQHIIDALQIKNSEEIIKFFDKNGEIDINNNILCVYPHPFHLLIPV